MTTLIHRRRGAIAAVFALTVVATPLARTLAQAAPAASQAKTIPDRLTDAEFWKFTLDMSEPDGSFRSENILSNETGYQMVIPNLLKVQRAGKVYMGVGPEQNFTYIAAIKPKMAIIVDIRRGNRCEHLLYKALFELSKDRAEFIGRLFSKPRPAGLDTLSSADSIMNAYWNVTTDTALYTKYRGEVRDLLLKKHNLPLDAADLAGIDYVYEQFLYGGLIITYNFSTQGGGFGRGGPGQMPNYYELMTATDGTGLNRGYLANETGWRWLKDLESRNMLVPVVGNFGGPKAIREVAKWLKDRNAIVTAFYASNVEQYLFQDGIWANYYDSVAELPTDSTSVFIRSGGGGGGRGGFGFGGGGMRGPNYMCPIQELLSVYKAGRITSYNEIFNYCR